MIGRRIIPINLGSPKRNEKDSIFLRNFFESKKKSKQVGGFVFFFLKYFLGICCCFVYFCWVACSFALSFLVICCLFCCFLLVIVLTLVFLGHLFLLLLLSLCLLQHLKPHSPTLPLTAEYKPLLRDLPLCDGPLQGATCATSLFHISRDFCSRLLMQKAKTLKRLGSALQKFRALKCLYEMMALMFWKPIRKCGFIFTLKECSPTISRLYA